MSTAQQTQQKQKYLRQNIDPDDQEDFVEYFLNEQNTQQLNIDQFTLPQLKTIIEKFYASKNQQDQEHQHERSFAVYQTADLQQAYHVLSAVQNHIGQFQNSDKPPLQEIQPVQTSPIQVQSNLQYGLVPQQQGLSFQTAQLAEQFKTQSPTTQKVKSPQKPSYQSASDLLDSVLASSDGGDSPKKDSPGYKNTSESKYRSNSQLQLFEKGNIWATTNPNIQSPRKSMEFDNFWQFSTTNNANNIPKKQEFKTENLFANQSSFDFNKSTQQQQQKTVQARRPSEPIPSFEQLAKNLNMAKKPNSYTVANIEPPSNMKKHESPNIPSKQSPPVNAKNFSSNGHKRSAMSSTGGKQIKLISTKPISEASLSNISNQPPVSMIKPPPSSMASAYKGSKIAYKGPVVHRSDFKDSVKCFDSSIRTQLNDPRLQVSIEKHDIIEKNFFVGDYVMYHMSVRPLNIVCKRNYEDFTKLKSTLQKYYPGFQLPWLEKNSWFETNTENIKKQKAMLEFFVNDLIKNPEIRNSRIFQDFLTLKEHKEVKRQFEKYQKMDEIKSLEDLCLTGGKVDVVINEQQRIYHENLQKIIEHFDDTLGKKNKLVEQLGAQFVQIHDTLTSLARLSTQMSEQIKRFNQCVTDYEIPGLESTMNIISKSYEEWASRISFESKVVNKRLAPFYKYQKQNLDTMRTLLNTQSVFFKSYMKHAGSELGSEIYTSSNLKNYKNGVLQESKNITVLKYQLGYLSNMVCKQSARFFDLMSDNFKAKWIYKAEKYNERFYKDIQFYNSVSAMAK